MCFTAIIFNARSAKIGISGFNALANMLHFTINNDDGFALVAYNKDKEIFNYRTMKLGKFIKRIMKNKALLANVNLIHIHFRSATSGSVNKDNIHLWQIGNYRCGHNGMAYKTDYQSKKCDSLQLLEKLNLENIKELKKQINDNSAWGIFLCSSAKRIIAWCNSKTMKLSLVDKNTYVLSSDFIENKDSYLQIRSKTLFGFETCKKIQLPLINVYSSGERDHVLLTIDLPRLSHRIIKLENSTTYKSTPVYNQYNNPYDSLYYRRLGWE